MSSNHNLGNFAKSNSLRPMGRPNSAGSKGIKPKRKGSPLQKLTAMFRRERNTENGRVAVRPSCFVDDRYQRRRSESPEGPPGHERSHSVGSRSHFKIWRGGKDIGSPSQLAMWRPKGRCEWESDSGRTLNLKDVEVSDLSKVETQALQRVAINQLQSMEVPVSHGVVKGTRNIFERLSFNTFNKRRVSNEKTELQRSVFGQPLTKVCTTDQPTQRSLSTSTPSTPGTTTPSITNSKLIQPPISPTGSMLEPVDGDLNPTTMLLEALSITTIPSPRAKRRQSLCPSDPQVPLIVKKAIHHLDTAGVKTEGIFRIPGAKSRIDEIRERFDAGQDVDLEDTNPHDVACLLKEFFRSLPEPLMTRELYQPFLSTRKLQNPGQRRDALRLLCLLLPQPNRDTLQELLQFLSRVALHSDGIILIDGTEETGNRMTEQNLAMILGPNILTKEVKRTPVKGDFQVVKQDPEELSNVCRVMEDLIRMHVSLFTVPAQLYDSALRNLLSVDPEAVDHLLKRKCMEQGLYLHKDSTDGTVLRSQSSEALRKISQCSTGLVLERGDPYTWRRSRSLSDTQKTLDEAIRNLEQYMDEELTLERHRRYSSNDSAMGESEAILSPIQPSSEPSTLCRNRQVYTSNDSAFSNNSSPTNSSEGAFPSSDLLSEESDSAFIHTRMSSNISGMSGTSQTPGFDSPELAASPYLGRKGALCNPETVSLPALSPERDGVVVLSKDMSTPVLPRQRSVSPVKRHTKSSNTKAFIATSRTGKTGGAKKKRKLIRHLPSISSVGTFQPRRSPILTSKEYFPSEPQLSMDCHAYSSDHTPTESTTNINAAYSDHCLNGTII